MESSNATWYEYYFRYQKPKQTIQLVQFFTTMRSSTAVVNN